MAPTEVAWGSRNYRVDNASSEVLILRTANSMNPGP